jgi:hypothetical protein
MNMDPLPAPLESVREALSTLGTPRTCPAQKCQDCEGCEYERREVNLILARALAISTGEACLHCASSGYVDSAEDSEFDLDHCPECKGSGVGPDFRPFSWGKSYQEYFLENISTPRGT